MNVKLVFILTFACVLSAAVIPKEKNEEQKQNENPQISSPPAKTNESDVKVATNKTLLSLTTPLRKAEVKENTKHEEEKKPAEEVKQAEEVKPTEKVKPTKEVKPAEEVKPVEKPHDDVHLQAGPAESEKQEKYDKVEEETPKTSGIRLLLFVIVLVVCACIAHTYRKKLMGFFISYRRTRKQGNARYRRLSTGEDL